jgi:hypothetical protein
MIGLTGATPQCPQEDPLTETTSAAARVSAADHQLSFLTWDRRRCSMPTAQDNSTDLG